MENNRIPFFQGDHFTLYLSPHKDYLYREDFYRDTAGTYLLEHTAVFKRIPNPHLKRYSKLDGEPVGTGSFRYRVFRGEDRILPTYRLEPGYCHPAPETMYFEKKEKRKQ